VASALQLWSSSAQAEVTLDKYVTRIEENPIEMHNGRRHALSEAEKLLLVQQDELRRLRDASSGSTFRIGTAPVVPRDELLMSPSIQVAPAPATPVEGEESSLGGVGNILGIVAAGILAGMLYQSRKTTKVVAKEFQGKLEGRDKERSRLCASTRAA
jgi:hypothetical protein